MAVGLPEFVENPEPRCPVILLLDTSGSMLGQPIQELNEGLSSFKESVMRDIHASLRVELAIITFGPVRLIQDFVTIDYFTPPKLEADGVTPMGEAIEYGLDLVEQRKQIYKANGVSYYRPWVILITDGTPTDDWQRAAQRVREEEEQRRMLFFTIAVEGADINKLRKIPSEQPLRMLKGLEFRSLFRWVSDSLGRVSRSKIGEAIALPPAGWSQINT